MKTSPPRALRGGERVLVRMPSWLGDFVMAEPALRALEGALGAEALTLVGLGEHLALVAERFPGARRIPLAARGADATGPWRGHDVALLFTGSFRSAWCAFRAGIPRRVGNARDGRALLLTDAVVPAAERGGLPLGLGRRGRGRRLLPRPLGRSLAELLGVLGVPLRHPEPRLDVAPEELARARARRAAAGIEPGARFALVGAGARDGSSKGVPAATWAPALAELRSAHAPLALVLAGGPGEERSLDELERALAALPGSGRVVALRAPVAGLGELLAHLAEAELYLGGDTGPRHLARAAGTPAVIVAGPTDPRHCAVSARERLVRVTVDCGPCHVERCPLAGAAHHACMRTLAPASIAAAARELLALDRRARVIE